MKLPKALILTFAIMQTGLAVAEKYPDNEGVSKMNQQLVEVGERHRYHKNTPKYNLSINPFGILAGSYSFAGSIGVSDNIALRGEVTGVEAVGDSPIGLETVVSGTIYFKKLYSGLYIEPGLVYRNASYEMTKHAVYGPQVLMGYTWFWDSGFNVSLAAGAGRNMNPDKKTSGVNTAEDYGDDPLLFQNGYLKIGYAI